MVFKLLIYVGLLVFVKEFLGMGWGDERGALWWLKGAAIGQGDPHAVVIETDLFGGNGHGMDFQSPFAALRSRQSGGAKYGHPDPHFRPKRCRMLCKTLPRR